MIKYVSPHHTPDDPGGLIYEVLHAGPEAVGSAEDIILSWVLRLDDERDPAAAAKALLRAYGHAEGPPPEGLAGRIVEMLRQTAASPRDRLKKPNRRRRR